MGAKFYNEAARYAYQQKQKDAEKRRAAQRKKKDAQPGKLACEFKAVQTDTGRTVVTSDDMFRLARCVGVTAGKIAWAIRTGGVVRYDHPYKIVPVEEE